MFVLDMLDYTVTYQIEFVWCTFEFQCAQIFPPTVVKGFLSAPMNLKTGVPHKNVVGDNDKREDDVVK